MAPLTLADHILFGIFAFVLPLIIIWRKKSPVVEIPNDTKLKIRIYWANSIILWIAALAVLAVWIVEGRSLAVLGFAWPIRESFPHWMLVIAVFLLFYYVDAALSWTSDTVHPAAGILPVNWREFSHFGSVVSLSAAFCEEIVFRGFFILYILALLKGNAEAPAIAIVGSSFVFGVAHEYQGGAALIKITLLSILFAWIFVSTHSLILVIALHFFVDFCSGLLALFKHQDEQRLAHKYS